MAEQKTVNFKKLVEAVAKSCDYHQYEVEDVLVHLSKVLQKMLAQGKPVKIPGVGKLKMQKLKTKETINAQGQKVCYDSFRLSLMQDVSMKQYLKENYVEPME